MGVPLYRWMVDFMENPNLKWVMTGDTPILGNPHLFIMMTRSTWCCNTMLWAMNPFATTRWYNQSWIQNGNPQLYVYIIIYIYIYIYIFICLFVYLYPSWKSHINHCEAINT